MKKGYTGLREAVREADRQAYAPTEHQLLTSRLFTAKTIGELLSVPIPDEDTPRCNQLRRVQGQLWHNMRE